MFAHNASSPEFLRKQGINRMWPTSPFVAVDLGTASLTGEVTDVAVDTDYASADVRQNTQFDRFNLRGSKLRVRIQ
jgi:hypothetical protein